MAVSTGKGKGLAGAEPTKYDYLALQNVKNKERYSSRNSTNASSCLSAASMLPVYSDQGVASDQEYSLIKIRPVEMLGSSHQRLHTGGESLIDARIRMRTSEPGKRLKQLFLNKQKGQNEHVKKILDQSEHIRKKSLATIQAAD